MKNLFFTFILLLTTTIFTNLQAQWLPISPIKPTVISINKCHIDDWTALKALYGYTNGDNWKNRDGWDVLIDNFIVHPKECDLSILEGVELNGFGRVISIDLNRTESDPKAQDYCNLPSFGYGNNLRGTLPDELSLLTSLEFFDIGNNHLTGNLPTSLIDLNNLEALYVNNNDLTGSLPNIVSLNCLNIAGNKFTCEDITNFNTQVQDFEYSPQYFAHNYDPIVADTTQTNSLYIDFQNIIDEILPDTSFPFLIWLKNGSWLGISGFNNLPLMYNDFGPTQAGKYNLHLKNPCGINLDFISDPIYVIYPGYDLEGQPVEYNQIMVEFDSPEDTDFYEQQILNAHGGIAKDYCNCNRELYLWEFPSDEATVVALLDIDARSHLETIDDDDGEVDGGLNNVMYRVGDPLQISNDGYNIDPLFIDTNYNYDDEVKVFVLDTGFDEGVCLDYVHLYNQAPIDDCYTGNASIGYNYTNSNGVIDDNLQDGDGHGTFGLHSIAEASNYQANNIKIVPLKVFDGQGRGNLFDFTCALYHAIDRGADIINVSAGYRGQASSILEKAINTAMEQDVFICASAGDDYIDNDTLPQYPASYAGMYHYEYDQFGEITDSIRYNNIISVASLSPNSQLSSNSNFGSKSVTMACYGEDLAGMGLNCQSAVGNGSSFATFVVTRFLALEIAKDNTRDLLTIWNDFESTRLWYDSYLADLTITGKKLLVGLNTPNNRIVNNNIEFIDKKNTSGVMTFTQSSEKFSAQILNTSIDYSYLSYTTEQSGNIQINLHDVNGRFITIIKNSFVNNYDKGRILLDLDYLQTGIYYINIEFQSINGKQIHKVLQFSVLN